LTTCVAANSIEDVEALYEQGRYVAAHRLAVERFGPLQNWAGGTAALVFGCRLAGNLGGERLAHALILCARRRAASDPENTPADRANAALFHAFRIFGRRGPLALRRFFKRPGVRAALDEGATILTRAGVLCLQAHIAAAFRDTDAAEALWQEAHALDPKSAWTWTERAALLVLGDRYQEAFAAAQEALHLRPWYRPAIQQAAHVLTLLGRDDEAVSLLEDALDPEKGGVESAAVAGQLAELCAALLRPGDALGALDRFEAYSPLLEEQGRLWLASRRGEARLLLGDLAGSADACEPLVETNVFYEKTVARLRDPERQAEPRIVHDVPFVRQHERTCAPATLAALSHFWQRPADHAAIDREICYGGTFDHQERHWAESHGWAVREFRADWQGSVALLDAGIPFALATTAINSGHLQAIIGYDGRRGTVVIRDPYERNRAEFLADEFFARYALWGPRAMAIVPADDAGAVTRLHAANLQETGLYDGIYRLRRALQVHDHAAARTALNAMEAVDPTARLTFFARRELAYYDCDDPTALAAVEGLLAVFPDEGRLRLEKLTLLRRLARPAEARAWLETCASDRKFAEPNIWRELARDLAVDARERPRARQLLARSLFYEPTEAEHLRLFAELLWGERDFAEAAALFRLAATSAGVRESNWQQFFVASRHVRQTDEAIRLLDARFRRLGDRSSQPARTLHWALRERHEFARAAAVLEESLSRRPQDGDLLLFAASVHARDGKHEIAERYLERAKGNAAPGAFSRTAAEMAGLAGDAAGALAHWRAVLEREPLDIPAHRAVTQLLAETDPRGSLAAREHLDAAVARFPHAVELHELRISALADEPGRGTPEHTSAVASLLAVQPSNVWALRESALIREALGDVPGALVLVGQAELLDPFSASNHALRGRLSMAGGDLEAARASLRRALELEPDLDGVLPMLLESSPTAAGKRQALDFMHRLLVGHALTGDGILAYRAAAYPILPEAELKSQLAAILEARPEVWQAWSAVARQHSDAGRIEEAHTIAMAAAGGFPLLPGAWLDLAAIEKIRGDDPAQVAALENALRIQSANGDASRRLAAAHRRAGRFLEARTVLEQAIAAAPLDVLNRGALAESLWQEDRAVHGSRVLEILEDAVRRAPGYVWGWDSLAQYARTLGKPSPAPDLARHLTATRPGEPRSWLRLALTLEGDTGDALAERLAALDHALELNPRLYDAHDLRAFLLAGAGRYEEALAACEPAGNAGPANTRPFFLEGRAAWVLSQRGDLSGARARMRTVLADYPGYEWGWRMLAEWAEAAGDKKETLTAAERVAFLSPHSAPPLGYLATARLRMGQRAAAKTALREAMNRDPAYQYAAAKLFDLQVEDRDFRGAGETLALLQKHHPGPSTLASTVLLAAKQKDEPRACAALAELLRMQPAPGTDAAGFKAAVNAMADAGFRAAAESALFQAMSSPGGTAHPDAGEMWVRSRAETGKWWGLGKAVRRLPDGELARRARIAYLSVLAGSRRRLGSLLFIRNMRAVLRTDDWSWGQAGYALTACGWHRFAVRWLTDWPARANPAGWMLFNLASSLRALGRDVRALEINRAALTLPPDQTRAKHLAWVAIEDAIAGTGESFRRATALYAEIAPQLENQPQPYRYLGVLTAQLLAVHAAEPAQRRAAYRLALQNLRQERASAGRGNRASRRAERRARYRLAKDAGVWMAAVRSWIVPSRFSFSWRLAWILLWVLWNVARLCFHSGQH
jgi:tetratricopeptide (TPR) repeat protein